MARASSPSALKDFLARDGSLSRLLLDCDVRTRDLPRPFAGGVDDCALVAASVAVLE
jgi:hypothetical protein